MKGVTPGRMVHYVSPIGEHRAAVITRSLDDQGVVNLSVYDDFQNHPYTKVKFDESNVPGTWHWIERV